MPRLLRFIITAALLGLLSASLSAAGARMLAPGTEVFAVEPGKVMEVTYRSPQMMLMAHRWHTGDRFTLIFLDRQRGKPATCLAGQGFDAVLNQLTSLKLRRTLDAKEAQELLKKNPVGSWAEIVVRDQAALEPFRALVLPVAGAANEAFVRFDGATYVVSFADQVLRLLAGGCKSLAAAAPPPE